MTVIVECCFVAACCVALCALCLIVVSCGFFRGFAIGVVVRGVCCCVYCAASVACCCVSVFVVCGVSLLCSWLLRVVVC